MTRVDKDFCAPYSEHTMAAPVKIGFLGGGMIAQIGHLPFYLDDRRCEVVRVCESRPSLVEALEQRLGSRRVVKDYKALFKDNEIQAIVISVPRPATGPLTLDALTAGKHVLAEKPMAHSVEQAQRLVEAATSRQLIYAIGFMKRYDPGIQAAKALFDEIVAERRLGALLRARLYDFSSSYAVTPPAHVRPRESRTERFPTWPSYPSWLPEQYRGTFAWFLNVASHDVNLLRFFFPDGVEVISAHSGGETSVVATMQRQDTTIVLEIARSAVGQWVEGMDFVFERGQVRVAIPSPMATDKVSEVILDDESRKIVGDRIPVGKGWSFARQATGFIDALVDLPIP
jgi:predicted dehydrogenase